MTIKHVQEGDVLDVINPNADATVSGQPAFVPAATAGAGGHSFVGTWMSGGHKQGLPAPLLVRGHTEVMITGGASAIVFGDRLVLNTQTGVVTKGNEAGAEADVEADGDADGDHLVNFGTYVGAIGNPAAQIAINAVATPGMVRLPPQ